MERVNTNMSAQPHILRLPAPERILPSRFAASTGFILTGIIGALLSILGSWINPTQFAFSWFFAFYFFFTIIMGAAYWTMLHYACASAWSVLVRRIWENLLGLVPAMFVLFIPLLCYWLRDILWTWGSPLHAHDHEVAKRAGYLNVPFFYFRVLLYFAYFGAVALFYRRWSIQQDLDGNPVLTRRAYLCSYMGLVLFGLVVTFVGVDWLMGLDWHWSSSLFGVYNFAICAQASMAATIVIVAWLLWHGYLKPLNAEHYHLMGKLLFGFTIFWAYIAFGQFLLIWFANIPEETIFYNDHNRGLWKQVSYFLIIGKFVFPVIYLLSQDTKRSLKGLTVVAAWLLFMHGIELYWYIMPYAHPKSILPSWQDFVAFLTVFSILGWIFIRVTASSALFPLRDPRLVESLTVTN